MSTFHWHCSDRNSNLCLNRSIWTLFHIKCAVLISLDLIFYGKHRFSFWGPRGHGDIKSASTLFIESQVKRVGTKLSLLFGNWGTWPLYNQCSVLKSVLQIYIPYLASLCWPLPHSSPTLSPRTFCSDGYFILHCSIWEPLPTFIYWAHEMWLQQLRKWIFNSN